jgi:hypothetical protein
MTPKEQGRFCGSCQKIVVDFSAMSDKELLNYISNASQHLCGRFAPDQLNKDLKATENKKRFSWAYVWNVLLATFLFTESYAQGEPVMKKKPNVQRPDLSPRIGTFRVEEKHQPGAANQLAPLTLSISKPDTITPGISTIGYKAKTLNLAKNICQQADVTNLYQELTGTLGAYVVGVKIPKREKVKRVINDWMPAAFKKDINIYPNPITRGDAIQVDLSLKQAGEYKLELMDAQGRVVEVQKLVMATKTQKVTVPTQTGWSPGIYYIRILAPGIKNVYQGKVVIQ